MDKLLKPTVLRSSVWCRRVPQAYQKVPIRLDTVGGSGGCLGFPPFIAKVDEFGYMVTTDGPAFVVWCRRVPKTYQKVPIRLDTVGGLRGMLGGFPPFIAKVDEVGKMVTTEGPAFVVWCRRVPKAYQKVPIRLDTLRGLQGMLGVSLPSLPRSDEEVSVEGVDDR